MEREYTDFEPQRNGHQQSRREAEFSRVYRQYEHRDVADMSDSSQTMVNQTEQYGICNFDSVEAEGSENKHIQVAIHDRSDPDGKIIGKDKQNALLKALFDMMYRELLSDADIKPRFYWSGMVENVFRAVAVGEPTAEFFRGRVTRMTPPWPGARLHVTYKSTNLTNVEAYVPGPLISKTEFYAVIKNFAKIIITQNWKERGVRPHGQGHVFSFSINADSYKFLDKCNGFIPYVGGGIEFRVLKD